MTTTAINEPYVDGVRAGYAQGVKDAEVTTPPDTIGILTTGVVYSLGVAWDAYKPQADDDELMRPPQAIPRRLPRRLVQRKRRGASTAAGRDGRQCRRQRGNRPSIVLQRLR